MLFTFVKRFWLVIALFLAGLMLSLHMATPPLVCAQTLEDCGECTARVEGHDVAGVWYSNWLGQRRCAACVVVVE